MCHLYQSVNKAKKLRKLRLTLLRSKVKKKKTFFTLFVCGEGGITNPLKTPAHQVQVISTEEAPLPSSEGKNETAIFIA